MKIIFMGTPEFACPTLKKLIESEHEVVAVFSQRPKPKGRGYIETKSPVQNIAEEHNIPIFTPKSLRNEESYNIIHSIEADIMVVIAYGFIIPQNILVLKKYGCINVHPSKLPKHRGAAPLQRTIIEGDTETAVCVIQMDAGMDTGPILMQEDFSVPNNITLPALHDKCSNIGADLVLKTLSQIENIIPIPQKAEGFTLANKLTKEEGLIKWNQDADKIECQIRGMNPWPGTYFNFQDMQIKIKEAIKIDLPHNAVPGTVLDNHMTIACKQGAIQPLTVQRPGKNSISAEEFMRSGLIKVGTIL